MKKIIYLLLLISHLAYPQSNSLTNGLVAYFNFQGNANDISASGYTGTPTGVTFSTGNGIINQGAGFNGTSSQVLCSNEIIPLGAKSICFWINPTSHAAFRALLGNNLISSANNGTEIFGTSSGGSTYQFFSGNGSGSTNRFSLTSPTVTDAVWNFVCFTWDGTTSANTVKAYVNAGTPATATAGSIETTAAGTNLRIGSIAGSNYYNGAMDELLIYNRQLTDAEIKQLYNNGVGITYPLINNFLLFLIN
jgi:hypothetical protein